MKPKHIIITLLVLVIASLVFYRIKSNSTEKGISEVAATVKSASPVTGYKIVPRKFANELSVSGSIEANEQVEIRSEVSGIVQGIFFNEGSFVNKGQLLVKINDQELKAQLSQAQTRQALAAENERRAKLLLQKEAVSQEEYDVANSEYKSMLAQTELVQAQLAKTSIVAPFSGKIGLRSISPGTYVTPTTLIANLVNINQVKVTFSIPEKYVPVVTPNTEISFRVAGYQEAFTAKIYAIEPGIEITTRTQQIRALADNKESKLLPGTFASVAVPLAIEDSAILIPSEAVIPIQNGKKVFVSSNGLAKEVLIETATRTDKDIQVISGLKAGDTVLTTGIMSLRDGSPLAITLLNTTQS
ncbi:efflux RND transporter periplasmic adaptor subunit [Arenibacter sp. GZD96]|uniref:efflux RND transporter periplasmic adaptor subunit n=1 Tax=Aurantibrevibacter litoralis TaxID=3106030 RepID=UPI002B001130|nr:efflux RND transporter periplasmic adaptor subunit [Arenibacter sp. GZD-96]MEA1787062.1 efflux RND transporter periplasmic adaptor subunit [Arenibacter sp. GZD-96]